MKHKKTVNALRLCAVILLCLALTALCTVPAFADSEQIKQPQTVKVGYYENEVFQEGAGEGQIRKGYAYEYYMKLSEYTGWRYEYVYGEYGDLYQKLLDGEIDLLAGLAYKEDRADKIGYPDEIMGSETYSLVKHDSDKKITTDPKTLNGKKIAVLKSAMVDALNKFLDEHKVEAEVVIFDDYERLFYSFDHKQVDVFAAEGDGAYNREHAEVLCPFGASEYYLCVSKNRSDLLEQLNTAQQELSAAEPNYISYLRAKYSSVSISSQVYSKSETEWINSHDSLTVGYLNHFLPFSDTDKDGNVDGMVKDLVPKIFEDADLQKLKINYLGYDNYDEMIEDMSTGSIDLAFPIGGGMYYAESNGLYLSSPVISATTEIIYKGEYDPKADKTFAVNKNNRMMEYFVLNNYPDAEITYYDSIEECLNAVMSGDQNYTALYGLRATDILRNGEYSGLSMRQSNIAEDRNFGVEIGNEGLLKLVNRGLSVIGSDYTLALAGKYSSKLYTYGFVDAMIENLPMFVFVGLVIVAMIILFLIRDSHTKKSQITATVNAARELEEKNAELAESKEALSNALDAAESANRAKTDFLNNMSHDIRTPMNAIVGFTSMAERSIDNKNLVRDYLDKISVSSRHLLSLINDVLDMSRIESGKMRIEEGEVHLPDLLHDILTIIRSNIGSKQLELNIDTQNVRNEDIITDMLRLNQVLLNILTNAVKFTPAGGSISFRVIEIPVEEEGKTSFEFRIKDTGIGMSEEFQKTLFDAFTREQNSTVSGIQGTGLGMAITKSIVDLLGGTITVSSQKGKGSEFVVTIPCKISTSEAGAQQTVELEGLRALVVDDNKENGESVCDMLRGMGLRPEWSRNGDEAVELAAAAYEQGDRFRVYIIDLAMPNMDGIYTTEKLREVVGFNDPVIIATAYDWTDIELEARDSGVTAFCSKPLFVSELKNVLGKPFRVREESKKPENNICFAGKRLLVAEDNEMNQMIAVSILESAGFSVEIAENGRIALDKVAEAEAGYYDAVLMDIQMPVMDGYEAAKRIRQLDDAEKANIPIVAVTANAFEEDRKVAFEAGMNGHLAKPYDIPQILKLLNELLNSNKE